MKQVNKFALLVVTVGVAAWSNIASAFHHGIYITESTANHMAKMSHLIQQAKKYGVDTFIVDMNIKPTKTYIHSIKEMEQNGITYVARVVIFPHGGTRQQVNDQSIWAKRLALAKYAIDLGAKSIQLDYIRYRAENPARPERAKDILRVVNYFKTQLKPYNVDLQMDIFGIASHKPAHTIGQDPGLLASSVNAFCPMVYPSHFEPFREHAKTPYQTIFKAITALKKQIVNDPNVAIYTYIELYNYRYHLEHQQRKDYIVAEMKAARDSGSNGWYVWSPNNKYDILFEVLANRSNQKAISAPAPAAENKSAADVNASANKTENAQQDHKTKNIQSAQNSENSQQVVPVQKASKTALKSDKKPLEKTADNQSNDLDHEKVKEAMAITTMSPTITRIKWSF